MLRQILPAHACTCRDEQAEGLRPPLSPRYRREREAAALRRQLQAMRDKVDTLHVERAAQQVTTSDGFKAAERHAVCEAGVLALDLRALEELQV